MQTLLISAQRVCHQWHDLTQASADLQAALFFKPVKYTLPRGTPGIRNPLLENYIWPWFCSTKAQHYGVPPVEGGAKIPPVDPRDDERFLRKGASWSRMLFQQPPRSCIGLVEKDGGAVNGPAYTEVKVRTKGDHLRIGDVVYDHTQPTGRFHPLPEEGLIWYGDIRTHNQKGQYCLYLYPDGANRHGPIYRRQVAYAISAYLRDCDIVLFILHCPQIRGKPLRPASCDHQWGVHKLHWWLIRLGWALVPGQISIPMPSN